jgi:ribosomal protein S27AE
MILITTRKNMPTFKCPQCGNDFQAESEGRYHCPTCDNTIAIHLHVHGKIPWETWREKGRLRAFFETWKQVMINPVAFFKRVPKHGNFVIPMYYGVICQSVAIILMWSYQTGFQSIPTIVDYSAAFGGYWPVTANFSWPALLIFLMALVLVAPVFAIIGIAVTSFLYHVSLKIFGGAKHGFEATFRAVCYSSSAQMISILPIVGTVLAGIWTLVLCVIGIRHLQETTYPRAVIAVILPVLVCCGFIILIVAAVFGAAIGAWMTGT